MTDWTVERQVEGTGGEPVWLLRACHPRSGCAGSLRVRFDIGRVKARHWYHQGSAMHGAPEIGVMRRQRTLTLCSDLVGCTELFDLRADEDVALLLVQAALLWLARENLDAPVMAELPGLPDVEAQAPYDATSPPERSAFFRAIGRHFLPAGSMLDEDGHRQWPSHLSGLLPRHPLYVEMLPPSVQSSIGRTHRSATPWVAAFTQEGFSSGRAVTVVDGGSVQEGALNASATARNARWREVFVDASAHAMRPGSAPTLDAGSSAEAFVLILDDSSARASVLRGRCDENIVTLDGTGHPSQRAGQVWCAPIRAAPRA